ncbi:hypothetical protein HMPREF1212_03936 [Parabacteroides sp. HGS0025]|mgnify:CR=1 FL=1|jgi:tryptophan synthase alpha subunit|nr:hypothetical protein HMPREF1212_03936 [Parabacteroides sp. HGS0025]
MKRRIIQIGNSAGVILPASILKCLKPISRRNWEAAASQMHAAGDDNLIMPDVLEDEKMEEVYWSFRKRSQ